MKKEINVLMIGPLPPEQGGLDTGGVATANWELAKSLNEITNLPKFLKLFKRDFIFFVQISK